MRVRYAAEASSDIEKSLTSSSDPVPSQKASRAAQHMTPELTTSIRGAVWSVKLSAIRLSKALTRAHRRGKHLLVPGSGACGLRRPRKPRHPPISEPSQVRLQHVDGQFGCFRLHTCREHLTLRIADNFPASLLGWL